jgi:hypothetical protein
MAVDPGPTLSGWVARRLRDVTVTTALGAAAGAAAAGLCGTLCAVAFAVLHGGASNFALLVGRFVLAGATAGGLTGLWARLIDPAHSGGQALSTWGPGERAGRPSGGRGAAFPRGADLLIRTRGDSLLVRPNPHAEEGGKLLENGS